MWQVWHWIQGRACPLAFVELRARLSNICRHRERHFFPAPHLDIITPPHHLFYDLVQCGCVWTSSSFPLLLHGVAVAQEVGRTRPFPFLWSALLCWDLLLCEAGGGFCGCPGVVPTLCVGVSSCFSVLAWVFVFWISLWCIFPSLEVDGCWRCWCWWAPFQLAGFKVSPEYLPHVPNDQDLIAMIILLCRRWLGLPLTPMDYATGPKLDHSGRAARRSCRSHHLEM